MQIYIRFEGCKTRSLPTPSVVGYRLYDVSPQGKVSFSSEIWYPKRYCSKETFIGSDFPVLLRREGSDAFLCALDGEPFFTLPGQNDAVRQMHTCTHLVRASLVLRLSRLSLASLSFSRLSLSRLSLSSSLFLCLPLSSSFSLLSCFSVRVSQSLRQCGEGRGPLL